MISLSYEFFDHVLDFISHSSIIYLRQMSSTSFSGLLSKTTLSEQHLKKLSSRVDDLKKASISLVEYFHMVNKGAEQYHSSTLKQTENLQQFLNTDVTVEKKFHLLVPAVFKSISINFHNFCKGEEASLKQYHVAVSVELDELSNEFLDNATSAFKKYRTREQNVLDSYKRYVKLQKTFNDSLTSYKNSLSDVKLIYNKEETLRRYQQCQTNIKNIISQEKIIAERSMKCSKEKTSAVVGFNSLGFEFKKTYLFIGEKIVNEAKNMMTMFCSMHKQMIDDISTRKKALEQGKISTFLDVGYVFNDYNKYFDNEDMGIVQSSNYPIFLEKSEHIKDEYLLVYGRWLNDYQTSLKEKSQLSQKLMKRSYSLLCDQAKTIEKMAQFMTKDVSSYYEKLRKRVQEAIGPKSLEYLKCVNNTLEVGMRIYQKLSKSMGAKLQHISAIMAEQVRLSEMFFKELAQQILSLNSKKLSHQQMNLETISESQKSEIKSSVIQKSYIIKHFLDSFGEKLSKSTEQIKTQVVTIVKQVFGSFNQIYLYATEYQHTYFGLEFDDGIKRCKADMLSMIEKQKVIEPISNEVADLEVNLEQNEKFKRDQYKAIRKPSTAIDLEDFQKQVEGTASEDTPLKNSVVLKRNTLEESKFFMSPIKMDQKDKKYFEFLKRKISFEEGEKFVKAYSCALYDRIILQGKLYITTMRLCFHSYFNATSLFFGNTFLQIPKKDLIKIQKRFNAIIFDNSLAVSTVNGEVFFTSFLKRNEAYKLVNSLFDLKCPESSDDENALQEQKQKGEDSIIENDSKAGTNTPPRHEDQSEVTPDKSNISKEQNTISREIQEKFSQELKSAQKELTEEIHITQQQQNKRSQSFQNNGGRNFKKILEEYIDNTNCLFLLRNIFADNEITINSKKYVNHQAYFMLQLASCLELKIDPWTPSFVQFLTQDNIKSEAPLHFKRKTFGIQSLPKTPIPFLPKSCEISEDHTLFLVSKDRFFIDATVFSKGAPYTDTFRIHSRMEYQNVPQIKKVKLTAFLDIEFLKSVMVKGIIQSKTTKQYEEKLGKFAKFINERANTLQMQQKKKEQKKINIKEENKRIVEIFHQKTEILYEKKEVQEIEKKIQIPIVNQTIKEETKPELNRALILENEKLLKQNNVLRIALVLALLLHMLSALLFW